MVKKQLFQIRDQKGRIVSAKALGLQSNTFPSKKKAKEARNNLNGEVSEEKHDHSKSWKYQITPGPDHWRMVYHCYGKRYRVAK